MQRGAFSRSLVSGIAVPFFADGAAAGAARAMPSDVAGVAIPDSALARDATEFARDACPPYLLNHGLRSFVFAALAARRRKVTVDAERLYVAAVLHDLGLTSKFMGPLPFEIQGAEAARAFLQSRSVAPDEMAVIWDAIVLHAHGTIAVHKGPEVALAAEGIGEDAVGYDPAEVPADAVKAIVAAFPRLAFKKRFVADCAEVVRRYPRAALRTFMEDIGRRYVAGFPPPRGNICDAIAAGPFDE